MLARTSTAWPSAWVSRTPLRSDACAPLRTQTQIVLDTTDPSHPAWTVVFYDQRSSTTNDIVVRVSARTGQTTTKFSGTPAACAQPH